MGLNFETQLLNKAASTYYNQKRRSGVTYSWYEFLFWLFLNIHISKIKKKHLARLTVGRIDHNKPYGWDNILLQDIGDNVKERLLRKGNPGRTHKKVKAIFRGRVIEVFNSQTEAAKYFKLNRKTVWKHCSGRAKRKNGVTFLWK